MTLAITLRGGSLHPSTHHRCQHRRYVHALILLLGIGITAADGQRATGADDLALGHEAVAASRGQ